MFHATRRAPCMAGFTLALGLTCSGLSAPPAKAAPAKTPVTHTFRYVPPVGIGPIETMRQTTVLEAAGRRTTRVTTARFRTTTKTIANGYRASVASVSVSATENGKPVREKILTDILKVPYTMDIGKNGQLLRVHGHEKALAQLRDATSPEFVQALGPAFSKEGLEQRVRAEWDRRIGDFAGETFDIGDTWEGQSQSPLGEGDPVMWNTRIRFAGTVSKAGRTFVRVSTYSVADSASAAKWAQHFVSRMMQTAAANPVDIDISGMTIVETGERLIHPSTMTIASESMTKRARMKMVVDGQTINIARIDSTEYTLELPAPKAAPKKAR